MKKAIVLITLLVSYPLMANTNDYSGLADPKVIPVSPVSLDQRIKTVTGAKNAATALGVIGILVGSAGLGMYVASTKKDDFSKDPKEALEELEAAGKRANVGIWMGSIGYGLGFSLSFGAAPAAQNRLMILEGKRRKK